MDHKGALHLLRLGPDPATGEEHFSVTYAPYEKRGGALSPYLARSVGELQTMLAKLRIDEAERNRALSEVRAGGHASLATVILSDADLKQYGLGEMGIIESVISYLST